MPGERGVGYTVGFAAAVCLVCSIAVSAAALSLEDRQEANRRQDIRRNVLVAAGLLQPGERADAAEVDARFEAVRPVVVDRRTGDALSEIDPASFDPKRESLDPEGSTVVVDNPAGLVRLPRRVLVYQVCEAGRVDRWVFPVVGKGLWSTLYGFLALDTDGSTIRGLAFYKHGETPGLGGEVDNPRWRARWDGRRAFDESGQVRIEVIKGSAGSARDNPYQVDGLSGATITSRGVSELVRFWMGDEGFGPFLEQAESQGSASCP